MVKGVNNSQLQKDFVSSFKIMPFASRQTFQITRSLSVVANAIRQFRDLSLVGLISSI